MKIFAAALVAFALAAEQPEAENPLREKYFKAIQKERDQDIEELENATPKTMREASWERCKSVKLCRDYYESRQ